MKPSEDKNRLSNVLEDATIAFWGVVVDAYPEAKHGDFPPDASIKIADAMCEAIVTWLEYNADPLEDDVKGHTGSTEVLLHNIDYAFTENGYDITDFLEEIHYTIGNDNRSDGELKDNDTVVGTWVINNR